MIPIRSDCLAALREYGVPDNIIGHSIVVERVALFLADELTHAGNVTDPALVSAGALLHDIAKMRGLREGKPHGELGAEVAEELGFIEVSPIVGQHVRLVEYADNGRIDEAKLVNYADKRVNHEQIVTLDERFDYLLDRYGSASSEAGERIGQMKRLTKAIEKQIFARLEIAPGDIKRLIEEHYGFYSR
ncbi:MAG: HDIG domain-containing protein [Deltaproteobacteria bacterium]|nr:HDIG domain-containing protein [Candidatus Zymogenaceae bacterium]